MRNLPEGIEISEKLIGSDAKLEILALFRENPELAGRIDAVGRRIGRSTNEIEADVKELIEIGVLGYKMVEDSEVIYLNGQKVAQIQNEISTRLIRQGLDLRSFRSISKRRNPPQSMF